jgi:hypothetical protein
MLIIATIAFAPLGYFIYTYTKNTTDGPFGEKEFKILIKN